MKPFARRPPRRRAETPTGGGFWDFRRVNQARSITFFSLGAAVGLGDRGLRLAHRQGHLHPHRAAGERGAGQPAPDPAHRFHRPDRSRARQAVRRGHGGGASQGAGRDDPRGAVRAARPRARFPRHRSRHPHRPGGRRRAAGGGRRHHPPAGRRGAAEILRGEPRQLRHRGHHGAAQSRAAESQSQRARRPGRGQEGGRRAARPHPARGGREDLRAAGAGARPCERRAILFRAEDSSRRSHLRTCAHAQ